MRTPSPWLLLVAVALGAYALGASCVGGADAAAIVRADSLALALDSLNVRHSRMANAILDDSLRVLARVQHNLLSRKPLAYLHTDSVSLLVSDTVVRDSLLKALTAERAVSDSVAQVLTVALRLRTDMWSAAVGERDAYRVLAEALNRQLQVAVHRPVRGRVRPCAFAGYGTNGPTIGGGVCFAL